MLATPVIYEDNWVPTHGWGAFAAATKIVEPIVAFLGDEPHASLTLQVIRTIHPRVHRRILGHSNLDFTHL